MTGVSLNPGHRKLFEMTGVPLKPGHRKLFEMTGVPLDLKSWIRNMPY